MDLFVTQGIFPRIESDTTNQALERTRHTHMALGNRKVLTIFLWQLHGICELKILTLSLDSLTWISKRILGCPTPYLYMDGQRRESMMRPSGTPWGSVVKEWITLMYCSTKISHREGKLFPKMKLDNYQKNRCPSGSFKARAIPLYQVFFFFYLRA